MRNLSIREQQGEPPRLVVVPATTSPDRPWTGVEEPAADGALPVGVVRDDAESGAVRASVSPAEERDTLAAARDEAARRRDARAEALERSLAASDAPLGERYEQLRSRTATDRLRAAADRERSARDRDQARAEQHRLESETADSHLDDLTGAYRREAGLLALELERDRARRDDGRFVLSFADVDGLKSVNDRDGHAAGDHVLRTFVAVARAHLRSFDPVVRYGGDEFVFGVSGIEPDEVGRRFHQISRVLFDTVGVGVSVGIAAGRYDEALAELVARADAAMLEIKRAKRA